jgi:4-hydroxymandelate oxidase
MTGMELSADPGTGGDALERMARRQLPLAIADFIGGGAGEEVTLRANERAWSEYTLWPRVLTDVSDVEPAVAVGGQRLSAPILVSPMGLHSLAGPGGELATARAAQRAGVGYVASAASSVTLEEIAAVGPTVRWFQMYWLRDRDVVSDLLRRARAAGYTGICLTVDAPVGGPRLRDRRNKFSVPQETRFANLERYGFVPAASPSGGVVRYIVDEVDPSITWEDLAWLRSSCDLPIILKGVLCPEDMAVAKSHEVDGLFISNHGGRQLDHAPATAHALARSRAIGGELIVDGGLRSAAAIAVAISLGATLVGIGRPVLWALATAGAEGVERMLTELRDDLGRVLALMGVGSVEELRSSRRVTGPLHHDP